MIKTRPNPRFDELRKLISSKPMSLSSWAGTLYRFQTVDYPTPEDVLSGLGAKRRGGRWNPPGLAVVYGSTTDTTALQECKATDHYYGIVTRSPRLVIAVEARLKRVLNLTSASVRAQLGVTLTELRAEDWRKLLQAGRESLTQTLGRAAFHAGASGIVAPSTAEALGVNVAIFRDNLGKGETLTVVEGRELRRLARKY